MLGCMTGVFFPKVLFSTLENSDRRFMIFYRINFFWLPMWTGCLFVLGPLCVSGRRPCQSCQPCGQSLFSSGLEWIGIEVISSENAFWGFKSVPDDGVL